MNDLKTNLRYSMQRSLRLLPILVLSISATGAMHVYAGTIFYNTIPATDSDANSGISTANQYTSAVDGGNTRGTDLVVNGITLYALSGNGQTSTADNCTLTALSGSLADGGGSTASIQADGTLSEVLSSKTFNNGVSDDDGVSDHYGLSDNSQQEIVLDPASLEAGATYDLRVYICSSSRQNRQVNLAFAGDGQVPIETGFFNEDDARTSVGGFTDPNQAYYINYRYTWDGKSTPGIAITQKSGSAPFFLYALTNQVVSTGEAPPTAVVGEVGLSAGYVNTESEQVGVASDDFYNSESLNKHGRWVKLDKLGASWQPTNVPSGWCPYTNGSFQYSEDCGWTFVSDEPWAWACYHYGRWTRVHSGCGWAWVPGKVWAGSWVSWRQGRSDSGSCIGWAPLPPEAGCDLGVGVSTWVDREYDIGPDYYTFINIRDFGADSYSNCGCLYDRVRNVTIINETINITNIAHDRSVTYCGGPNYFTLNQEIQRRGGRAIAAVNVKRLTDVGKFQAGRFAHKQGNQLALLSPRIKADKLPLHSPKMAETLKADKIDKGWGSVKDPRIKNDLKKYIADQTKGQNPKTMKATLPPDVAQNVSKKHGNVQHPGAPFNQHAGPKYSNQQNQTDQQSSVGPVAKGGGNVQHPGAPFNQHPGPKYPKQQNQPGPKQPPGPVTQQSVDAGGLKHPKQQNQPGPKQLPGPVTQQSGDAGGLKHLNQENQPGPKHLPGLVRQQFGNAGGSKHLPGPVRQQFGNAGGHGSASKVRFR